MHRPERTEEDPTARLVVESWRSAAVVICLLTEVVLLVFVGIFERGSVMKRTFADGTHDHHASSWLGGLLALALTWGFAAIILYVIPLSTGHGYDATAANPLPTFALTAVIIANLGLGVGLFVLVDWPIRFVLASIAIMLIGGSLVRSGRMRNRRPFR